MSMGAFERVFGFKILVYTAENESFWSLDQDVASPVLRSRQALQLRLRVFNSLDFLFGATRFWSEDFATSSAWIAKPSDRISPGDDNC